MAKRKGMKVDMYLSHVEARVEDATDECLHQIALQVEGTAKRNITVNDQVDTGFMLNSLYVESRKGSTFGSTWENRPDRKKAPRLRLPSAYSIAAVVIGAVYAIYQEVLNPFLRPAGADVMREVKGICEPIYKRMIHD